MSNQKFILNSITNITKGDAEGSYLFIECNITTPDPSSGVVETYDAVHVYRESDPYSPLSPAIKAWMAANPEFPIGAFAPYNPTPEQARQEMPSLTARQFRLGLVAGGKTPTQVTAVIDAMPEGAEKEVAKIEWEYATTFKRTHPLVMSLGGALGLTPEQIDTMWANALTL